MSRTIAETTVPTQISKEALYCTCPVRVRDPGVSDHHHHSILGQYGMGIPRRRLLSLIPAGTATWTIHWQKPIVQSVLLPAHAQASGNEQDIDPQFEIRFQGATTEDGVTLIITGGTTCYEFGIRETSAQVPWEELYHPTSINGVALDRIDNFVNVVLGDTTLFGSAFIGNLTFIVRTCDLSRCWVWGHDPSSFAEFGCTVVN
jgi:hypothetical protein